MKDYFVFSPGRVKRHNNTFYFIDENNNKQSLPINQIDNVYLFGKLDMNTDFLQLLNQHEISMHIFNYYGFYSGSFNPRKKKVSGFSIVNQSDHYLNKEKRQYLANKFVESAAFHMIRNIRKYQKKSDVSHIISVMQSYYSQITDMTTIQKVMGLEGIIRQSYYASFNLILD